MTRKTPDERILDSWKVRPCFICHLFGQCKHREYDVELALAEVQIAREKPVPRKGPGRALTAVPPRRRKRA